MATIPKVIVVGDGGAGKTAWIHALKYGQFEPRYLPTIGVEVVPYLCETNVGPVRLSLWDCAGQKGFGRLNDAYYLGAHAAIVVVDATTPNPVSRAEYWCNLVRRSTPYLPIVLAVSKSELLPTTALDLLPFATAHSLPLCAFDSKEQIGVAAPLQLLLLTYGHYAQPP